MLTPSLGLSLGFSLLVEDVIEQLCQFKGHFILVPIPIQLQMYITSQSLANPHKLEMFLVLV